MPNPIVDISQAVKQHLEGQTFAQAVQVSRSYRPRVDLAQLDDVIVTVVPRAAEDAMVSRGMFSRDVEIDVAIQAKLTEQTITEQDALMALVQEIADALRGRKMGDAVWIRQRNDPIYAPEHLDRLEVFTSLITVTYRTAGLNSSGDSGGGGSQ